MSSEAELAYLIDGIAQNLRNDGRSCEQTRPIKVEFDVIPSANSSARVTRDSDSSVLVGIKAELTSELRMPDEGLIDLNIEFASGEPETELDPIFSFVLPRISLDQLCIKQGVMAWHLHVDCLVERSNGSILDLVALAMKLALSSLTLPQVSVLPQAERGERQRVNFEKLSSFDASSVPLCLTFGVVRDRLFIDPNSDEELATCGSLLTACISENMEIMGIVKTGSGSMDASVVEAVSEAATAKVGAHLVQELKRMMMEDM